MVHDVLRKEEHLLADDEWPYLSTYSKLSCKCHFRIARRPSFICFILKICNVDEARYLLVRLCLRKEDKWHRLDQLKYQREIGDPAKITNAIRQLCNDHEAPKTQEVNQEETEIIDLTLDDEEDEPQTKFTAAPVLTPKVEEHPEDANLSQASSSDVQDTNLAEDETKMTLRELLECLNAVELKKFAKQMKLKLTGTVYLFSIPPNNWLINMFACSERL